MHNIKLPYGQGFRFISIPSGVKYKILKVKEPAPIVDFPKSLTHSLNQPIVSKPLGAFFTARDKIAILIPDKTRRCPADKALDVLIKRLRGKGVDRRNITVILARGSHSPHTPAEIKKLVGAKIYRNIKIIDHDAHKPGGLSYIGTTSRGTRVSINRHCAEADRIITVGTIGYHYYAGFSGGRKLILPGVAAYETIQQNHSLVLNKPPARGKNPDARMGKLDGNPVNEDMIEAAELAGRGRIFSVNLILDSGSRPVRIFCGDIIDAHRQGCDFVNRIYRVSLKSKADCVIVSAGGQPVDINFIQAHKAVENASYALKDKGRMLVLAECDEGIGSDILLDWFKHRSIGEMETELRKKFVVSGHTALCSLMKAQRFDIHLYSRLKDSVVKSLRFTPVDDLQRTLDVFFRQMPNDAVVFILAKGGSILPSVS